MRRRLFILILIILILPVSSSLATGIALVPGKITNSIGESIEFLIDKEGKMDLNEVQKHSFTACKQTIPNFGSTNAAIWFRIKVKTIPGEWLLEAGNPIVEQIDFYYPTGTGYTHIQSGADYPYESKIFKAKPFLFPLSQDSASAKVYYLRLKSSTVIHCSLKTGELNSFMESYQQFDLLQGIYFGFIALMVLYNLIIYLSVRDKTYLYYVAYAICLGTFVAFINGYAYQYMPFFYHYFRDPVAMAALIVIFGSLFSGVFLKVAVYTPKLHKGLIGIQIALGLALLLSVSGFKTFSSDFLKITAFLATAYLYIISIIVYKRGYKPSLYYIIAWTFILIGNTTTALYYANKLPANDFTMNAVQIGSAIEVVLLSLALAYRMSLYKKEKEIAQETIIKQLRENEELKNKVTRELEKKVAERTIDLKNKQNELLEANQQLKILTEKLHLINSRLDIDNWELKKEVKEKTKAIMLSEKLSYEEFSKVFPDELACFRFMEEMKWTHGYTCKKCSHTNYSEGFKKFSRKCNRCDYTESVTAFTLFHGLKFPLNKAFFITYVKSLPESDYSIRELAGIVDIHHTTCSAFIKKVEERKIKTLSKAEKKVLEKWESLVLDTLD